MPNRSLAAALRRSPPRTPGWVARGGDAEVATAARGAAQAFPAGTATSPAGGGPSAHRELVGTIQDVGPGWQAATMRPALKSGLLPVWRDRDTLQIGIDPRRAIALSGMGQAAFLIGLLDGSRDRDQVIAAAAGRGIPVEATERVLTLLAAGGALDDFPASTLRALPAPLRAKLAAELATTSLAHRDGDGGARALARRRAAVVRIEGDRRIGRAVARILSSSGVGQVQFIRALADSAVAGSAVAGSAVAGTPTIGSPAAWPDQEATGPGSTSRAARATRPNQAAAAEPRAGPARPGLPAPTAVLTWSFSSDASRMSAQLS